MSMTYIEMLDTQSRLHLHGGEILFELSREQILSAYNGIGSASMPAVIRWTLTALNPAFVLPAVIHDCAWTYYHVDFYQSNADFEFNCVVCVDDAYRWYNPARYVYRVKAAEYRRLLDKFGKSAYLEAQKMALE